MTQIKTQEKDGYESIQLGFEDKKEKNTSKAMRGHFAKAKTTPKRKIVEFQGYNDLNLGDFVTVDQFQEGEYVDVVGTSKGKGFQGVVKKHGFGGVGQATHGQHNRMRAPGSIGAASYPSRVFKGMKMGGRTGGDRVKSINLLVLKVIEEKNLIIVKGSVPGSKGSYLIVEK